MPVDHSLTPAERPVSGVHFAMGGAIFGELTPDAIALAAHLGFPGIEPYRSLAMGYVDRPVSSRRCSIAIGLPW